MQIRNLSFLDQLCLQFDQGLKTLLGVYEVTARTNPAEKFPGVALTDAERKHAAGLMRVNHTGEICAQALYQGQALTAKNSELQEKLMHAAQEENDHLAWCQNRLTELNSRTSYLNPLWYIGSFAIGAIAGLTGDANNLGFLAETEQQVEKHLASHLEKLPANDQKSRAIVTQMQQDEIQHANMALNNGAATLPNWVKTVMRYQAKVMTATAYYL